MKSLKKGCKREKLVGVEAKRPMRMIDKKAKRTLIRKPSTHDAIWSNHPQRSKFIPQNCQNSNSQPQNRTPPPIKPFQTKSTTPTQSILKLLKTQSSISQPTLLKNRLAFKKTSPEQAKSLLLKNAFTAQIQFFWSKKRVKSLPNRRNLPELLSGLILTECTPVSTEKRSPRKVLAEKKSLSNMSHRVVLSSEPPISLGSWDLSILRTHRGMSIRKKTEAPS